MASPLFPNPSSIPIGAKIGFRQAFPTEDTATMGGGQPKTPQEAVARAPIEWVFTIWGALVQGLDSPNNHVNRPWRSLSRHQDPLASSHRLAHRGGRSWGPIQTHCRWKHSIPKRSQGDMQVLRATRLIFINRIDTRIQSYMFCMFNTVFCYDWCSISKFSKINVPVESHIVTPPY